MPVLKITAADIAKTKNLEPGWYGASVCKVHPLKNSSGGDSINQQIDFLIDKAQGKEIPVTFNTKLLGKIAPLWEAALGKKLDEGEFDTDMLLGKKVDVKVQPVLYNGNMIDNILMYLPYGKSKDATPF
jgi:hypothetical protein